MDPNYIVNDADRMRETADGWEFDVGGTGFKGTFGLQLDHVPLEGAPVPFRAFMARGTPAAESAMPKPAGETGTPGA